jgi:hypothetical protein
MPGEICEFDWGTIKPDIGGAGYQKYQMAVFTSAYGNLRYAKLYLTPSSVIDELRRFLMTTPNYLQLVLLRMK